MTDIILCGASGRMGKAVAQAAADYNCRVVAGADRMKSPAEFPIFERILDIDIKADVIIDFSHHSSIKEISQYVKKTSLPAVIATTGHDLEETELIKKLSKNHAIFRSRNMSLGINLLINLCKTAATVLGNNFDIEIIEQHHNKKLDSPSGTALMIAESIREVKNDAEFVYGREKCMKQREKSDIGIHAVRGGNIVGDHEVLFCGNNEIIKISHSAFSRELFAEGALRAAEFIKSKQKGLFTMEDLLSDAVGTKNENIAAVKV